MGEQISNWEHLTTTERSAQSIWKQVLSMIKEAGREDILQNPTVLDLGGGAGEFSKNLNAQGINCVSLDIQNLETNPGAKQVRSSAYQMPFTDNSFNIIHSHGVFDKKVYKHDFAELFAEVARVLKEKGILFSCEYPHAPKEELEKYFKLLASEGEEYYTLWEKK